MRRSASIACACVLLLGLATPARSAEGVVRGAVVDQSGGVLPGVTVTATALDGRPFGITCSCLHPGNVLVERRLDSGRTSDDEPMMQPESIARAALAMVTLPADVNFLEAIVLPRDQAYLGRG